MKKILAMTVTLALASTFVGISGELQKNPNNALRDEIDKLHIAANAIELDDSQLVINDDYMISKTNDYHILPRNIDTYRDNVDNVNQNTANQPRVQHYDNDTQARPLNNGVNTQTNNGVAQNNATNGVNKNTTTQNSANTNSTNTLNNNANINSNQNYNNGTNNLSTNNQGTSPYGINNANSGVLPNQGNGNKVVNDTINSGKNGNLDSMVRTNNIDTYKNNTNTNIDGNTYNNNGGVVNNGVDNLNGNNTANNTNSLNNVNTPNNTTNNTNTTNNATTNNNENKPNTNTPNNTLNNNTTQNNVTPQTNNNTNKPNTNTINNGVKTNDNANQNTTNQQNIAEINDRLANLNSELNNKMETARQNMDKVINKTVELDENQVKQIDRYSHVLQCMTKKLAQSHFDLMRSAGLLALTQSTEGNSADVSPIYLEMKGILLSREVFFECANEALDKLNGIFDNLNNTTQNTQNQASTNENTTIQNQNVDKQPTSPILSTRPNTSIRNPVATTQNTMSLSKASTPSPNRAQREILNAPLAKFEAPQTTVEKKVDEAKQDNVETTNILGKTTI